MVEDGAVIQDRLGHAVGWILGMFYAYYGLLVSQDPEWLQVSLNIHIGLFRSICLAANISKSKNMTC